MRRLMLLVDAAAGGLADWTEFDAEAKRWGIEVGQSGLLLVVVLLLAGMRELLRVKWHDLPLLILLGGAVLFTVFPVTFNASLRLIEASRGALVLATIPLWSALLARMARSERLVLRQVVGVFLSLGGVGLALANRGLGWQGGLGTLAGDGLIELNDALTLYRGCGDYEALSLSSYKLTLISRGHT